MSNHSRNHKVDWSFKDTSTSTGISSTGRPFVRFNSGTGEQHIQEKAVKDAVKNKDREKIRATVKEYLTTQLKTEIRGQLRALSTDLAQLKREKKALECDILALDEHIDEIKNQFVVEKIALQDEIKELMRILDKKADDIIRFQNMELD